MVFNPYIATRPRTSRRQAEDSAGAGAAKIPRVGVNKSDLEAQGELHGWSARELTYTEVREMSSSELRWHEQFNATNLENALATPAKVKEGKDIDRQWGAKKFWDKYWGTTENQAEPEEAKRILAELQKFQASFPQFIASRSENAVLLEWLKDRNMDLTYRNLAASFEANALEGKVWLNPNAISAGSETEVSGQQLLQHHNFFKLIQPQQRMSETDRLSAQEFYDGHKELHPKQVSPFEMQKRQKAESTQAYFAQAASAQSKGNVVNLVDYGEQTRGVPPEPEKYSFKQKIRSMSASEIAQRCQDDPAFKKALDELK